MDAPRHGLRASAVWPVYLAALLFFFARFGYGFGFGDHDEVMPYLLHLLDSELFQNDWFVQLQAGGFSVRSYFVWLLFPLCKILPVWLVLLAVYLALWFAVAHQAFRLSYRFIPDRLVAAGSILVGMGILHKWTLGSNDLIYSMLVPEMLSWALALAAIRSFADRHPLRAGLMLGIAAWFQILVGLQTALVLVLIALLTRSLRWKTLARFLAGFVGFSLPVAIPIFVQQLRPIAGIDASLVFYVLAPFRNPFHHMFLSFGSTAILRFGMLTLLGVASLMFLIRRNARTTTDSVPENMRDGWFLVRFVILVFALLAIYVVSTELVPLLPAAKLQLFKLTAYLKHIFVFLVIGAVVSILPSRVVKPFRRLLDWPRLGYSVAGVWVLVLLLGFAGNGFVQSKTTFLTHRQSDLGRVEHWIRDNTQTGAVFAVPPSLSSFRTNARRAIVVNYAAFPFVDDHIVTWYGRLLAVAPITPPERGVGIKPALDAAFHSHSEETWLDLAEQFGFNYLLLDKRLLSSDLSFVSVFSLGDWIVYRIGESP